MKKRMRKWLYILAASLMIALQAIPAGLISVSAMELHSQAKKKAELSVSLKSYKADRMAQTNGSDFLKEQFKNAKLGKKKLKNKDLVCVGVFLNSELTRQAAEDLLVTPGTNYLAVSLVPKLQKKYKYYSTVPLEIEVAGEAPEAEIKEYAFDPAWEYGANAKITSGTVKAYYCQAPNKNGHTVCINAGHGTKGGTDVKTLCHPDGSPKLVSGTTQAGATEAVAISAGITMLTGEPEAAATLKAALAVKDVLLDAGYNVLMIREGDDVQLDNIARTLIANHYADAHIALHYDSTENDKGAFYCSVPDVESYRNMEPVKSHWKEHELLGASLINGLRSAGIPIWNDGTLPMDLTQTSYSTIASVDLEIGDSSSDYSEAALGKVAQGIKDGLDMFFERAFMAELERANTHDALVAENGSFMLTYTYYMKDGTIDESAKYGDETRQINRDPNGDIKVFENNGQGYGYLGEPDICVRYLFPGNFDTLLEWFYVDITGMSYEKIISMKKEDGLIYMNTIFDPEYMEIYKSYCGYQNDKIEKAIGEYVIDAKTKEILKTDLYFVLKGKKVLYYNVTLQRGGEKQTPDQKIIDGLKGDDTWTMTVITDGGTEQEKTYSETAPKGCAIKVFLGEEFEEGRFRDPEYTEEIPDPDYTKDVTYYLKRVTEN